MNPKEIFSQNNERQSFSLNEDLAIVAMKREGLVASEISTLTGRSVNSIRHRFFKKNFGIWKLLANETSCEKLYILHGEQYIGPEDINIRINAWKEDIRNGDFTKAAS